MAYSVNRIQILGNVGGIEMKTTGSGKKVATISVATNHKYGDKEETTWHRVVVWEKLAELAEKYVKKGEKLYVEGRLTSRTYEKDGQQRQSWEVVAQEIVFLGGSSGKKPTASSSDSSAADEDEDIPF